MGPLSTLFKHPGVPEYCCRPCSYIYDLLMATCSRVTQHVSEIKQHLKWFSWTQNGLQKYQSLKMSQSIKALNQSISFNSSAIISPWTEISHQLWLLLFTSRYTDRPFYEVHLAARLDVLSLACKRLRLFEFLLPLCGLQPLFPFWPLTPDIKHGIFLHATAAQDQSTEEVQASGQDAYWTRFWGGVLGIPCEEEALGQTQDLLKRLSVRGVYTVYTARLATTTMSLQQVLFTMSTCLNASICLLPRGWLSS